MRSTRSSSQAIGELYPSMGFHPLIWEGTTRPITRRSPVLAGATPVLRRRLPGAIGSSTSLPGTPSMHTVWVLMAETGLIDHAVPAGEVVPAQTGADGRRWCRSHIAHRCLYKRYQATDPSPATPTRDLTLGSGSLPSPALKRLFKDPGAAPRSNPGAPPGGARDRARRRSPDGSDRRARTTRSLDGAGLRCRADNTRRRPCAPSSSATSKVRSPAPIATATACSALPTATAFLDEIGDI